MTRKELFRKAVVHLNGQPVRDVMWADEEAGEVCALCHDGHGKRIREPTKFAEEILRGQVSIEWRA